MLRNQKIFRKVWLISSLLEFRNLGVSSWLYNGQTSNELPKNFRELTKAVGTIAFELSDCSDMVLSKVCVNLDLC